MIVVYNSDYSPTHSIILNEASCIKQDKYCIFGEAKTNPYEH